MSINSECPFKVGDKVRFQPGERTQGHYQNIERFGIKVGQVLMIKEVKENAYLYFENGAGGWPWNEFVLIKE